ncbi:MAG: MFS transporter [Gaiellaceae bacterium]
MRRVGPLAEREFRLLFLGRTTSFVGNSFANVALAFAVLDLTGSRADLGLVLAARSLPQVVFLLVGGIWADWLPRHRVMVVTSIASGASQAAAAGLLLSGHARIWELAALGAANGTSTAFFFPASTGIVPQTVPAHLLQRANAFLRLGINASTIGGAALGGLVVAATSPGTGIAVDAASFLLAAVFIRLMRTTTLPRPERSRFLRELGEGWHEVRARTWLWAIVLQFGFVNAAEQGTEGVLGPAIAKEHLGGAFAWGLVLTGSGLGLLAGGLVALRFRPRRILLAATLGFLLTVPFLFSLAGPLPLVAIVAAAFVAGIGSETFGVLWDTAIQQEIPLEKLSRVSSYDALGSLVLIPLGLAVAGPLAQAIGTRPTILAAGTVGLTATLAVLLSRDVRTLERRPVVDSERAPAAAPA